MLSPVFHSTAFAGRRFLAPAAAFLFAIPLQAQTSYQSSADFEKYARMLREKALLQMTPVVVVPASSRPLNRPRYPWKNNIVTTLFWVGKANSATAWDAHWAKSFGGSDDPAPVKRRGFIPAGFTPRQNPFYCALPYNDVTAKGTKPEAKTVIPWFQEAFEKEGQSVCQDRWVRIRSRNQKDCYAQWSDAAPFRADHWQYVFGDERPKANANQGAGLGISPAIRDYLGLQSTDVTDWQFVDFKDVPRGPWSLYGENNHFVQMARRVGQRVELAHPKPADEPGEPVITADPHAPLKGAVILR